MGVESSADCCRRKQVKLTSAFLLARYKVHQCISDKAYISLTIPAVEKSFDVGVNYRQSCFVNYGIESLGLSVIRRDPMDNPRHLVPT
jgi:hypothetical protein